ncbi:MAG: ABC transporter permease [Rhodospirillales bacterium]|nr:ABC transporter permease [Rhodospirillales bacterium]
MTSAFTPGRIAASLGILVVFLAGWEWGPGALGIKIYLIPPLSSVAEGLMDLFRVDNLWFHIWVTTVEVVAGFVMGSLLGVIGGYALGLSVTMEVVLSPYILALQIAPKVAFAPLFVLWFGFGLEPRILIAVLIVFFPVLINVMTAVRNIDPDLINLARSFKASRMQVFWKIQAPASMPPMFAGLRIGATLAVIGVAVGEFAGGNSGVGYLIILTAGAAETPKVFAAIFVLTVIGILAYWLVILAESRVLHYMPSREYKGF